MGSHWVRVPLAARMDCKTAQKNINSFLRETLRGNELRRTYYHLKKCQDCKEVLLDEFSFYTTFNDLDKDLDFNYQKQLNEFMKKTEDSIKIRDNKMTRRYILVSILICVLFTIILVIALRVTYR